MTEFRSPVPLPNIPDDLSIPQFMLREVSNRPVRPRNVAFFIEDDTGRRISYEEIHHRTYSLANALSIKWNISKGDVVCLFSPNHTDYATVIWAVHTLGGVITPANPSFTVDELKYQLSTTNVKLVITHPSYSSTAIAASTAVGLSPGSLIQLNASGSPSSLCDIETLVSFGSSRPENYKAWRLKPGEGRTALAFLSLSSGTTGKPKAVAIPHYSVIANIIQMAQHYRINDSTWPDKRLAPGDVAIAVLPFFHIYGLVVIMHFVLFSGLSIVVVPKFNFTEFLRSIVRHRVTHLYLVPPQIVLLCKRPDVKHYNFNHVKFCLSGAAPLGGELMKQITHILPYAAIGQGYGLTETCTTVSSLPHDCKYGRIGSAGRLIPGIVAKVVKPDGTLAAEGEQGELVVTGPSMALRYLNNPEATAETFVNGWIHTGDEVIIKDNEVYVVDRLKEIMKVRGFQVAPAELEAHLLLHPDIVDVCVIGIPDQYNGEVPLAYVVPSATALQRIAGDPAGLIELKKTISKHVSDVKVRYKWLAGGVEFIDAIPKNPSGKILRRVLREQAKELIQPPAAKL